MTITTFLVRQDEHLLRCVQRLLWVAVRNKSGAGGTGKKSYADTINLPRTDFPLSMKGDVVVQRELNIQKICDFSGLYSWQWNERKNSKLFVLHDGPPYANGKPHVGHAINKILKDITNRYQLLRGHRVHYKPGWDCHGLPIEQKALASVQADHRNLDPVDIRSKASSFAKAAVSDQMSAFRTWGVMADWKNGCYYTLDPQYETRQLELFYQLYEKKYIYRDYMPTFWSPSSKTALAEAEIEYDTEHKSRAVYVKYPLSKLPPALCSHVNDGQKVYVVIWTTTPWTLPLNRAICYGSNILYSLLKGDSAAYIVASEFKEKLSTIIDSPLHEITTFTGSYLDGAMYESLSLPGYMVGDLPLLSANHVTVAKGTGLVHTAPAHGVEDFQVAVRHGLPLDCYVDEDGCYTEDLGSELKGKFVLEEGNQKVLNMMSGRWIIHTEDYVHSYPLDWRTKKPLILRASKQWFVNTSAIKQQALDSLQEVKITPSGWAAGMLSQLTQRTYWCISRQRVWGVPIPVFYNIATQQPLISRNILDHLKKVVTEKGTDCWWKCDIKELLPLDIISKSGGDTNAIYEKGRDVLDIWFDSGASWFTVLSDCDHTADVYLEGVDQFGGWFQSSLLTSVATNGRAPYRKLVVHGFTVDEEGKKMSKSIGNVIDPYIIINGGKDKKLEPAYGVDVLRLWVAQSGPDARILIGPTVLSAVHERLFKMRKSLRYLISNLYDFNMKKDSVPYSSLLPTDRYILHILCDINSQVVSSYEEFSYSKAFGLLEHFVNVHMSGLHAHVTKDRMYCGRAIERRSAQTVQHIMLDYITRLAAPVVPHLAEEICSYTPLNSLYESIFKTILSDPPVEWRNESLCHKFLDLLALRDEFNTRLATDKPSDYDLHVTFYDQQLYNVIKEFHSESTAEHSTLLEILGCARATLSCDTSLAEKFDSVSLKEKEVPVANSNNNDTVSGTGSSKVDCVSASYRLTLSRTTGHQCSRCRKNMSSIESQLCSRCEELLRSYTQKQQQQH